MNRPNPHAWADVIDGTWHKESLGTEYYLRLIKDNGAYYVECRSYFKSIEGEDVTDLCFTAVKDPKKAIATLNRDYVKLPA